MPFSVIYILTSVIDLLWGNSVRTIAQSCSSTIDRAAIIVIIAFIALSIRLCHFALHDVYSFTTRHTWYNFAVNRVWLSRKHHITSLYIRAVKHWSQFYSLCNCIHQTITVTFFIVHTLSLSSILTVTFQGSPVPRCWI